MNVQKRIVEIVKEPQLRAAKGVAENEPNDLRALTNFVSARRWTFLSVAIIAALSTLLFALARAPKYTATALVMISAEQRPIGSSQQDNSNASPDSSSVDSQIEILQSHEIVGELVDRLQLVKDPKWNPALQAGGIRSLLNSILPARAQTSEKRVRYAVIERVAKSIISRRKGQTFVIAISATSYSPEQAADMANSMIEVYERYQLKTRFDQIDSTNDWLSSRLAALKSQVQQKEDAVERYRAANGLLTAEGSSMTEQQARELQQSVLMAKADLAERQARYEQVKRIVQSGGSVDTLASALNSETIRNLRSQESELASQQADMVLRYGPKHPSLEKNRRLLDGVQSQIRNEIGRIAENQKNEVEIAATRLATLQNAQGSMTRELISDNAGTVKLRELERDAAASRALYESFLARFQEGAESKTQRAADIRMVGRAATPNEPSSPNLRVALLLALVIGAGAGLAAAYVIDAFDQSLKSVRDIERYFGEKPLATIPYIPSATMLKLRPQDRHPAGYVVERPMSAAAEGFRTLRAALLYAEPEVPAQVIAITSAVSGEGKTSSSFAMARIAALSGQRVVVIDCDLRKQALTELADVRPVAGILQLLRGTAKLDEVIHVDIASGAHVIPALSESFTVQDVFGSAAMVSLVKHLRTIYDLVIFDCPPFLAVAESRVLTRLADQTIVLARWGWCSPDAIQNMLEQLVDSGAYIRGIALTCVNSNGAGRSAARPGFWRSKFTAGYYVD